MNDQDEQESPPSMFSQARDYVLGNWVPMIVGFVLSSLGAVVVVYMVAFGRNGISRDPADWGTFGDYVGGVLNPLVAFAALALLAYSVHIQRREVTATRRALQTQANHSEDMVRVSAMIAVIAAYDRKVKELQVEISRPLSEDLAMARMQEGRRLQAEGELSKASRAREYWERQVENLLTLTPRQELRRMLKAAGIDE